MSKTYAIEIIKEEGVAQLIDELYTEGEGVTALNLIENCWGNDDKDVIDYIKINWEF